MCYDSERKRCFAAGSDAFSHFRTAASTVHKYFNTSPLSRQILCFPLPRHVCGLAVEVLWIADRLFRQSVSSREAALLAVSYLFVQKPAVAFSQSWWRKWKKKKKCNAFSNTVELNIISLSFVIYRHRPCCICVLKFKAKASWLLLCEILKKNKKTIYGVDSFIFENVLLLLFRFWIQVKLIMFCLVLWGLEVGCELLVASSSSLYTFVNAKCVWLRKNKLIDVSHQMNHPAQGNNVELWKNVMHAAYRFFISLSLSLSEFCFCRRQLKGKWKQALGC